MPYHSPGVYVKELEPGSRPIEGVGTAVAAFVGLAAKGPPNDPQLITNWTQFTDKFGGFIEGSYLAHAVYGYFLNGGGACYVVRIGADGAMPAAKGELKSGQNKDVTTYIVHAREPGPDGNEISIEVAEPTQPAEGAFDLVIKRGDTVEETYPNVSTGSKQNVVTATKSSKLIRLEEVGKNKIAQAERRPAVGVTALTGGAPSEQTRLSQADYVGNSADRTGFGGLEAIDDVTMLAVPDLMAVYQQGGISLDDVKAVQGKMFAHCELMGDRVAILDTPPGLSAQQVKSWLVDDAKYDSKYAAMYWPWIKVSDPLSRQNVFIPPSGHMAGIWARSDSDRGVHKAPANEVVRGAISLELQLTRPEHDLLNPVGLNCIRAFPGRGLRVWGARTLSSDQAWRYLNVRRLFNYIEESLLEGTQWVVFEPNDLRLWQRVKRTISAFLLRTWRDGALFGATPEEAFYVKCDSETNPPEGIEAGELVVEIGIAPVKPAEFVVIRIAQFAGGAAVSE